MGKKTEPNIMARIEERRRIFERRYDLLDLEREYRGGEGKKEGLPLAVAVCLRDNIEIPEWARRDFCVAVLVGMGPWEKDFGHRKKDDGWTRKFYKLRRQIDTRGKDLFNWIENQRKDSPVDPALFEQAGNEFKVSSGTAKQLYYSKEVRRAVAIQRMICDVEKLERDEIGPHADQETRTMWASQNRDRIIGIERYHCAAVLKPLPRKSKRVISKKVRPKI